MNANPDYSRTPDVTERMAIARGNAIHEAVERAWVLRYAENLKKLGHPDAVINRIKVNPDKKDLKPGDIPVYLEQRAMKTVGRYTIGGKFDFVGDGLLEDIKTTSVYSYLSGNNDWKYILQGSLYRWLNPDLITQDHMNINYDFADWKKSDSFAQADKGYPPTKMHTQRLLLKSVTETEVWVRNKIELLDSLEDVAEPDLPDCSARDLWQDAPTFKYYKNSEAARLGKRSTKNFTTAAEAQLRYVQDGSIGTIVEVPGLVQACKYAQLQSPILPYTGGLSSDQNTLDEEGQHLLKRQKTHTCQPVRHQPRFIGSGQRICNCCLSLYSTVFSPH